MSVNQPVTDGKHEWRRGWPIVAGSAALFATGPGLYQNLSSLFVPGMQASFGWSRGDISTAAGIGLLGALSAPFIGRLVDRIGAVPVLIGSALVLGGAHAWLAAMTGALWQFQIGVALLALSAPGISALVFGKLIARRFDRHRGFALGVATAGLSVSTLLLPPLIAWVIAVSTWRSGYLLLAGAAILAGLPLALLAIRATRLEPISVTGVPVPDHPGLTGRAARRTGIFWRLALSIALINMATIGFVTQLVPFGMDRALGVGGAAMLVSAYALSQVVGRLGMGALVDHFPANRLAALVSLVSAAGFAALFADSPGLAIALVAVFFAGLMNGAEQDLLPYLVSRLFGLRAYGEIFGSLFMLSLFGSAIGIVGFGRLHDSTGGYDVALLLAGIAMVVAAALLASLRATAEKQDNTAPLISQAFVPGGH
jgi:MFS family permease